jgi:hypothetical protein
MVPFGLSSRAGATGRGDPAGLPRQRGTPHFFAMTNCTTHPFSRLLKKNARFRFADGKKPR